MVCTLHSLLAAAAVLNQASSWTPPTRRRPALAPRHALKVEQDARWPGWTESVDPAAKLLYMPFLETQLKILEKLGAIERPEEVRPDLRLGERPRRSDDDAKGAARVLAHLEEGLGATKPVLMETPVLGRTHQFTPVRVKEEARAGEILPLRLAAHDGKSFEGLRAA